MAIETLYRVAGTNELYTSMEEVKKAEFEKKIEKVLMDCQFTYLGSFQAASLARDVAAWLKDNYVLTEKQEDAEAHYD